MHSTDGITWTDITPVLSFDVAYFNDVVYDGSKYHFMGTKFIDPVNYVYGSFFSVSTATVTNANSFGNKGSIVSPPGGTQLGGYYGESAFAYANGKFGGAVSDMNTGNTYAVYSLDGVTWNAQAVNETTYIYGAITDGNKVRLIGSGDGKVTLDFGAGTLPVTMLNFTALPFNGEVQLKWQTASKQSSAHFTIQHSTNNTGFSSIGTITAKGNSGTLTNYNFVNTIPAKGNNYYRLLLTDANGKNSFSEVRLVTFGKDDAGYTVIGNPVTNGFLQLKINKAMTVSLSSADGQLLWTKQFTTGIKNISVNGLGKGLYLLSGNNSSQKIILQ